MGSPLIDFPQLVDLALGTPESGAVNFNILHALLHGIVQLLDVEDVRVELTGILEPPQCGIGPRQMSVEQYMFEQKGTESTKILIEKPTPDVSKIIVVRKSEKGDTSGALKGLSKAETAKHEDTTPEKEPSLDTSAENESGESIEKPQTTQDINFVKRLDNTDKRIAKMENSLNELQIKYKSISNVESLLDKVDLLEKKINPSGETVHHSKSREKKIDESGPSYKSDEDKRPQELDDFKIIQEEVQFLKNEVDQIKIKIHRITKGGGKQAALEGSKSQSARNIVASSVSKVSTAISVHEKKKDDTASDYQELLGTLNHKFEVLNSKFLTMTEHILDIEKELCEVLEKFEEPKEETKTADVTITDLHNELLHIKSFITETAGQCHFLMSERNQMRTEINRLVKTLNEMADTKVDKDDIDELLAEKADYNMLQRKVSMEYFDASKRDLESVMLETINKMQEREAEWCKTIENMKRQLESKLNASEITAVKEYLERRLQMLADRMSVLCAARKDPEAAGTRVRLLKNLSCISCNQHVLMRTEEIPKVPKMGPMPTHKSMKPFLTYELDNVRKQMKDIPNSRNMHHFEAMYRAKGLIMDDKARQICTRYCGGSHTIITPQDRVERGRCGKILGARTTTAKCICAEPEPPPCTCPDEPEEPECTCPEEAEVCSCSSESDPFDKCISAQEKRCIDIDQNRRENVKEEYGWRSQRCKEKIDERMRLEETKKRDKCKMEIEMREKCLQELQLRDRCSPEIIGGQRYKEEIKKYGKCKELGQRERRGSRTERYTSRGQSSCFEPKDTRSCKGESGRPRSSKAELYPSKPNVSASSLTKIEPIRREERKSGPAVTSHVLQENETQPEPLKQPELQAEMPEPEEQKNEEPQDIPEEIQAEPVEEATEQNVEQPIEHNIEEAAEQNLEEPIEQNIGEANEEYVEEEAPAEG